MRYSIIVVCYNAADKLNKTISSILTQTYLDYEIVIKDGQSTDDSIANLPIDDRINLCVKSDSGIYDAMNQAIEISGGNYLIFLNCGDTFYDSNVLLNIDRIITQNSSNRVYYGNIFHEARKSLDIMPKKIDSFTCFRHMPCHQSIVYSREVFSEKSYDTNYKIRGDYDHFLWLFFVKKVNPLYMGITIASYEGDGYSESKKNKKLDKKEHRDITKKYISKGKLLEYKLVMIITLSTVRTRLANSQKSARFYNKIRSIFYRNR